MLVIAVVLIAAISARRRHDIPASSDLITGAPLPSPIEQSGDDAWQQRMLAFVGELRGSLTSGQIQELIATRLPPLLGVDRLWIETTIGGRRQMIAAPLGGGGAAGHPPRGTPP